MPRMSPFKHHRFLRDIIQCAVRWYLYCSLSYQGMVDFLSERGITVDRSTIYDWAQKFAPELTKRTEKYLPRTGLDWHVDETYIRVGERWRYLYQAVDANGQMIDSRLSAPREAQAATNFLNMARDRVRLHRPMTIVTDKARAYRSVIREINFRYNPHFDSIRDIDCKWRNNVIGSDHDAIKRLHGCRQSFRSLRMAKVNLSGKEAIITMKRGSQHMRPKVQGKFRFINPLFDAAWNTKIREVTLIATK